jgi:lysophospholipase L1-like esterase
MLWRRRNPAYFLVRLLLAGVAMGAVWLISDRRTRAPAGGGSTAPNQSAPDPAEPSPPPPHVGRFSYLALGDSYTIGERVAPSDRWPMQLAALLRKRGIDISDPRIIARTGWTTADLLDAMDADPPAPPFSLVTLLIGVNNQFRGRSQDEYRQQFVELLRRSILLAGGSAKRVVVLSIPDWSVTPYGSGFDSKRAAGDIDRFNAINRQEAQRAGVAYVDITPETRQVPAHAELVAEDGLHPSGVQYGQWADLSIDAAAAALASAQVAATQPSR